MKYKSKYTLLIIFVVLTLFVIAFFIKAFKKDNYTSVCGKYAKKEVQISNKIIFADISDNDCKRQLGLSSREALLDGEGMLFIFERAGNYGFWMKDMSFPLDILWINDRFEVVGIERNVSTSTYPQTFGEKYLGKYVLEVSAGYSDKNNIKIGEKIHPLTKF